MASSEARRRFPDELRAYMDERGIESLTELHRLYLESGGKQFISPLFDALGLAPPSQAPEGNVLLLAYGLAYRRAPQER